MEARMTMTITINYLYIALGAMLVVDYHTKYNFTNARGFPSWSLNDFVNLHCLLWTSRIAWRVRVCRPVCQIVAPILHVIARQTSGGGQLVRCRWYRVFGYESIRCWRTIDAKWFTACAGLLTFENVGEILRWWTARHVEGLRDGIRCDDFRLECRWAA